MNKQVNIIPMWLTLFTGQLDLLPFVALGEKGNTSMTRFEIQVFCAPYGGSDFKSLAL